MRANTSRIGKLLLGYLALVGALVHLVAVGLVVLDPEKALQTARALKSRVSRLTHPAPPPPITDDELKKIILPYQPQHLGKVDHGVIDVSGQRFDSFAKASRAMQDGDTMIIGAGIYREPLIIRASNTAVIGDGLVIIEEADIQKKGAILVQGNWTELRNISCRKIESPHRNGACVRLEGKNLFLNHVHFYDSEQGLLAGGEAHGVVEVLDSRFENLGAGRGQAHGIYMGGGELSVSNSVFLRSKEQGHEIKSRASKTQIRNSIIASLDGRNSRLVDVPNGGVLLISQSILAQGPNSVNRDAIGYGLEGRAHPVSDIRIENNVILLERPQGNVLFHANSDSVRAQIANNVIVAPYDELDSGPNVVFKNRAEAGLKPYPALLRTTN